MSEKFQVQRLRRNVRTSAPRKVRALVRALLQWFSRNARDLPWRRARDPYAIWVSEIMLQQTQVKTVIPYWQRWMRELPTLQALAEAKPEHVLKLWEGLGYYTRARNLQKAAQVIVTRPQREFPREFEDILALPGVGRYTAGAIGSIAFNRPTPILDGNIIRVLTRVFNIDQDPREKSTNTKLWRLAELLVKRAASLSSKIDPEPGPRPPAGHCSSLNQSLMELGAVICTPRQPQCSRCPLQRYCLGHQNGRAEKLPYRRPYARAIARRFAALVVQHRDRFWVRRRPAGLVNGGLWEFPNRELENDGNGREDLVQLVPGASPASLQPFCTVYHCITRFRIRLEVYRITVKRRPAPRDTSVELSQSGRERAHPKTLREDEAFLQAGDTLNSKAVAAGEGRWLRRRELERLAFPSAHRKVLQKLMRE